MSTATETDEIPSPDSWHNRQDAPDGKGLQSVRVEEEREYVSGTKAVMILVPVTLVFFLLMLDSSIIATAIPAITTDFDSLLDIGWYGGAYQLASSAFQPMSGKIYTYFSIKWSFLAFLFLFELGSAICGAAQSSSMFIIGRAVAGLGSSGLTNGALTIIAAILPPHKQPLVMGVNVGLGQVGIACGPLIGGAFTDYISWRWCFYINLPLGALIAPLLVLLRIPEPEPKKPVLRVLGTAVESLDLPGFMLIGPAAVMFFLALQWGGNQYAWSSATVIGLFAGAAVLFGSFLVWEQRQGDDAMVPFSMIRKRVMWSASGTMFFFMGAMFCANFYLPIYFQAVKNDSTLMSGVHVLPTIVAQVVFSVVAGVMVEILGYYLPWVLVGSSITAISYGLLSLLEPSTPVQQWVGYQILYGIGIGAAAMSSYIAVQNLIPARQIPIAMGILTFCSTLGAGVFLVAAQAIFSNTLREQIQENVSGVNPDLIIIAGARSVRQLVSGAQLVGVLQAYSTAVNRVMYLGIGLSTVAFAFAWGLGWKDVRKKKDGPRKPEMEGESAKSA
ncbi:MFS general substrate transporter [Thozetella sp. PMI_491]|nr:MFS general substrate transporter [Thozetella sp. PMI_491]